MIRNSKKMSAHSFAQTKTGPAETADQWEVRPGGMLVQKRGAHPESASDISVSVPSIRVRVMYGTACHEICLSCQSTFGELKKLLSEWTGLHPQDQKILYKDKERESSAYLDILGVKDRSKMVLMVDPTAHAKRVIEMRRAARLEKASELISSISSEVDRLASKVSALEAIVSKGKKIADEDVVNLIEQLMSQMIKLDGIVADGDVKLQRGMQVRRVQKYVEMLDMLKIKNAKIATNGTVPLQQAPQPVTNGLMHFHQQQQTPQSVVVTTDWEMFDSLFSLPASATMSTTTTSSTTSSAAAAAAAAAAGGPRFDWELF